LLSHLPSPAHAPLPAVAGNFLGVASEEYGVLAVAFQAIAYFLSGYYATGGE